MHLLVVPKTLDNETRRPGRFEASCVWSVCRSGVARFSTPRKLANPHAQSMGNRRGSMAAWQHGSISVAHGIPSVKKSNRATKTAVTPGQAFPIEFAETAPGLRFFDKHCRHRGEISERAQHPAAREKSVRKDAPVMRRHRSAALFFAIRGGRTLHDSSAVLGPPA